MQKRMIAKFPGRCARTGAPIRKGDEIIFDTETRRAYITDEDDERGPYLIDGLGVSNVVRIAGQEYYRNKRGRCIDAPCCGCCTI